MLTLEPSVCRKLQQHMKRTTRTNNTGSPQPPEAKWRFGGGALNATTIFTAFF